MVAPLGSVEATWVAVVSGRLEFRGRAEDQVAAVVGE
jgi:hypothetical protein